VLASDASGAVVPGLRPDARKHDSSLQGAPLQCPLALFPSNGMIGLKGFDGRPQEGNRETETHWLAASLGGVCFTVLSFFGSLLPPQSRSEDRSHTGEAFAIGAGPAGIAPAPAPVVT
jgi:hypothetical protein